MKVIYAYRFITHIPMGAFGKKGHLLLYTIDDYQLVLGERYVVPNIKMVTPTQLTLRTPKCQENEARP